MSAGNGEETVAHRKTCRGDGIEWVKVTPGGEMRPWALGVWKS